LAREWHEPVRQRGGRLMAWARLDDGFDEHPKIEKLFDEEDPFEALAAVGLWTVILARVHREMQGSRRRENTIPGFIRPAWLRQYGNPLQRKMLTKILVRHHLWDIYADGWMVHDVEDYLPSSDIRRARSIAGKKGAAARWGKSPTEEENGRMASPKDKTPKSPLNLVSTSQHDVDTVGWQTDGTWQQTDGNLPSDDGSLLQTDGKPMARAGTGAGIPNPITPTSPSEPPVLRGKTRPRKQALPGLDARPAKVQTIIADWIDRVPHRPHGRTIGAAAGILKDAIYDRAVPEALVREAMNEWITSGKASASILRTMIDERINKAAAEPQQKPRCPDHRSYYADSCPHHEPEEP
jgi:hypothetical protein